MTISLNTSHSLYPNLISLIAVDGGVLVDVKNPSTVFTPDASSSFGTGGYGPYFRTLSAGTYSPQGASFSPALSFPTSSTPLSYFVAFNKVETSGRLLGHTTGGDTYLPNLAVTAGGLASIAEGYSGSTLATGTTNIKDGAQHTVAVTRPAGDSPASILYVDGASQATASGVNYGTAGVGVNYIGGEPGQNSITANIVFIAFFNKVLTSAEVSTLHSSLTGGGSFALIQAAALSFSGTIPGQSGVVGTAFSWSGSSLASFFSNGTAPISYSYTGTLPPGLSFSTSTGIISGTPTTQGTYNITPSATDSSGSPVTVPGNSFSISILGAGTNLTVSSSTQSNLSSTGNITQIAPGQGTITTLPLKNNTGSLLASVSNITVWIYNVSTGALVLTYNGLLSNSSGILTFTDPLIVSGISYRLVIRINSTGAEGLVTVTAA